MAYIGHKEVIVYFVLAYGIVIFLLTMFKFLILDIFLEENPKGEKNNGSTNKII